MASYSKKVTSVVAVDSWERIGESYFRYEGQ